MKKTVLILFVVPLVLIAGRVEAQTWGPWSVTAEAPALLTAADSERPRSVKASVEERGIAGTPFVWMIKFYQKVISPVDGDRCPMYPTCSQYSIEAIRKHGPVMGIIMTADRLMHELDEQRYVPLAKVGNRYRYLDPVTNNDFWWYGK